MKQLRGLGAVHTALEAAKGTLWAVSVDPPQTMREERAAGHVFAGSYVHASKQTLNELGLLHRGRTREIAAPASILISADQTVAWTYYSARVGERAEPSAILDALKPWTDAVGHATPNSATAARAVSVSEDERSEHRATKRRLQEVLDSLMDANDRIGQLNEGLEALVVSRTEALNASLAQSQAVLESMADGLISVDSSDKIRAANPAFSTMLGIPDVPLGFDASEVLPAPLLALLERARTGLDVVTADFDLPDGAIGAVKVSPILGSTGVCVGHVLVLRDVTLEKRVDQMKTNFITTVSHELRTPLTSVLGFARLTARKLESHVLPHLPPGNAKCDRAVEQVRNNLRIITTEGVRLTDLINDVLDISKMEAGRIDWKREVLSPAELVERAVAATTSLFDRGLEARTEVSESLPPIVGDSDRVIQVLVNLISNGAKFTSEGWVEVKVAEQDGGVAFSVSDTGVGIAPADQQSIFERFRQVGDTLTDKPGGTGLGLAICAQIAEAHQGTLSVSSEPGKGSTFMFWLPAGDDTAAPPQARPAQDDGPILAAAGQQILVVDDDPSLRELLRQQLTDHGYIVHEARDGVEAIQKVRDHAPDLIVLDVMMPGISGFDVAAVLKADTATQQIPLVILSIMADQEQGYTLGVDHYFTKPTEADVLLRAIQKLLDQVESPDKLLVVEGRSDG